MRAADRFPGALMGIDWGGRRVGVAVSDPSRTLARPLTVLVREGPGTIPLQKGEKLIASLQKIAADQGVTGVVFGVPYYHLSGDSNPHAPLFLSVAREIARELALPLFLFDEGQSTGTAREVSQTGKRRRASRGVDHVAAATFLQGFLDSSSPPVALVDADPAATGGLS